MTKKKDSRGSLEQSLKRLSEIVEAMELGNVPLEDAMALYEEGIQISKECAEKLKSAELKIQKLSKNIEGRFTLNRSDQSEHAELADES